MTDFWALYSGIKSLISVRDFIYVVILLYENWRGKSFSWLKIEKKEIQVFSFIR